MGVKERTGLDSEMIKSLPVSYLDYYVALAMGYTHAVGVNAGNYHEHPIVLKESNNNVVSYTPSLSWKNAGPLIEAFDMDVGPNWPEGGYIAEIAVDIGTPQSYAVIGYGSTYQEAICRTALLYLVSI